MSSSGFRLLDSENVQFEVSFAELIVFEEAIIDCDNKNSTLAHVNNRIEFDFIKNIIDETFDNVTNPAFFFLGYDGGNVSEISTVRYKGLSEDADLSFIAEPGSFPWNINNPNDVDEEGRCIEWALSAQNSFNHEFIDFDCNEIPSFHICRKDIVSEPDNNNKNKVEEDEDSLLLIGGAVLGFLFLILTILIGMYILEKKKVKSLQSQFIIGSKNLDDL